MSSWRVFRPISLASVLTLALLGLAAAPAQAEYNTSARHTWSANNTVYAITTQGNRIYVAGRFTRMTNLNTGQSISRQRVAAFDASTGDLITSFNPSVNNEVRAIAVSADGQRIFLGGRFTSVNGSGRTNVAAVNTQGDLISGWNANTNSRVKDIVRVDNDLYLAGTFGRVNGVTRPGLAKISVASGGLSSWKVVANGGGKPRSIAPSANGDDLIVGGSFGNLGGQPRQFLGSVDLDSGVTTSWHPNTTCSNCDVFDVVADSTGVYTANGGGGGGRSAKYFESSNNIAWVVRGDGNCQAIDVFNGTVYIGGHFGPTFDGHHRTNLAAVSATNGNLLPFDPNLGTRYFPGVWAIDASSDFLRVGGGFRSVDGDPQARYAEFPDS